MAFDKKAYNREYYRNHKSLWDKYRDVHGSSGFSRYGNYGQAKAAEEAKKRSVSSKSSFARSGAHGSGMAEQAKLRSTYRPTAGDTSPRSREYVENLGRRMAYLNNKTNDLSAKEKAEQAYLLETYAHLSKRSPDRGKLLGYTNSGRPAYFSTNEGLAYAKSRSTMPVSEQAKASYARGKATLHYGNASGRKNGSTKRKSRVKRAVSKATKFIKNLFG